MTTDEIMRLALGLVRWEDIPDDCAIFHPGTNIQRVLIGIDIGAAELKIAKDLGYDCCIAHHPMNQLPNSWKMFERHVDQMVAHGVSQNEALKAVTETLQRMEISGHIVNYDHLRSVARLLEMPFLNIHSPLDERGRQIMQGTIDKMLTSNPNATVGEIIVALGRLDEFKHAETDIRVRMGRRDNRAGRVVFSHACLTNGGYAVATAYFRNGVNTVCYIHIRPEDLARLCEEKLGTLIVTGHIASDSVGINPFIARLRAEGIEVDTFSGIVPAD